MKKLFVYQVSFFLLSLLMFCVLYRVSVDLTFHEAIIRDPAPLEQYYIEQSKPMHATYNVVTAILADYRSLDTFLEMCVIFLAAIGALFVRGLLLGQSAETFLEFRSKMYSKKSSVIRNAMKIIFPLMVFFGWYVFIHGHYSPGGGFQAGVILGAAFILYVYVYASEKAFGFFLDRYALLLHFTGVIIYFAVGLLTFFVTKNFLDYEGLRVIFSLPSAELRSLGILLVELGVTLTVMTSIYLLFRALTDIAQDGEAPPHYFEFRGD